MWKGCFHGTTSSYLLGLVFYRLLFAYYFGIQGFAILSYFIDIILKTTHSSRCIRWTDAWWTLI